MNFEEWADMTFGSKFQEEMITYFRMSAAWEAAQKEEREACAQVCEKGAASYRAMKGRDDPVSVTTSDEEYEELSYCCELNAKYIREGKE